MGHRAIAHPSPCITVMPRPRSLASANVVSILSRSCQGRPRSDVRSRFLLSYISRDPHDGMPCRAICCHIYRYVSQHLDPPLSKYLIFKIFHLHLWWNTSILKLFILTVILHFSHPYVPVGITRVLNCLISVLSLSLLSLHVYIGVRANIHLGGQTEFCPNGFSGGGGSSRSFPGSIFRGG